jgi:hypothetical protein
MKFSVIGQEKGDLQTERKFTGLNRGGILILLELCPTKDTRTRQANLESVQWMYLMCLTKLSGKPSRKLSFVFCCLVQYYLILYMILLHFPEMLITLCNSRKWTSVNHAVVTDMLIFGSLVRRNDNIFVMKRGKTLNSFLVFKYRLRPTINTIFEFVNPTLY